MTCFLILKIPLLLSLQREEASRVEVPLLHSLATLKPVLLVPNSVSLLAAQT